MQSSWEKRTIAKTVICYINFLYFCTKFIRSSDNGWWISKTIEYGVCGHKWKAGESGYSWSTFSVRL